MQIMIDAMTLEGKWFGPEPSVAPTIVMLHEGLGSVSTWRDFPEQLTEATGPACSLIRDQGTAIPLQLYCPDLSLLCIVRRRKYCHGFSKRSDLGEDSSSVIATARR